jgi:4-amino-4-deoxy-L-arabinose transferase-like glycosyltransferase
VDTDPKKSVLAWSCGLAALAAGYRCWLAGIFWGHEEEDWANLIHVERIAHSLRSGTAFGSNFTELVDLEHMPLFTWLCGVVAAALGDAHLGAECVTITMGAATVALVTFIGWRWFSPAAGIIAGLLVTFQPEAALYSASPLRESTYSALMLGGVALVGLRRFPGAALVLGLAFLCRFNIAFSILPALVLWALYEASRLPTSERTQSLRGPLITAALTLGVVAAWAIYYRVHSETSTWVFWGGVVDKNAGRAVTDLFPRERVEAIALALGGVFTRVVPSHFGWLATGLAIVGLARFSRTPRAEPAAARWLVAAGLSTLALFALTALVSAYPPDHNLYWKWLCPSVPYLALFAGHGLAGLLILARERPVAGSHTALLVIAVLSLSTAWDYREQTRSQVALSEEYAGNQVRLARWVEEDWPANTSVLTANGEIAQLYLAGRTAGPRALDWLQHAPRDDPGALGQWLLANQVGLVIWFHEEWTGCREVAGFLAQGNAMALGPVSVEPIGRLNRSDGAGFTAYQVRGPDPAFAPSTPPPALGVRAAGYAQ